MSEVSVSGERRLSQQCVLRLPSHPQSCHPPRIINITNLQGRTWPANPHCNYIKYHTHSTNSDQSLEITWQSSHSRREEKRRGAKERKFPTVGSWRAGSFDLLSLSVSPFSARTELRCLRVFFALFTLSIWLPFSLKCVSCVAEIYLRMFCRTITERCSQVVRMCLPFKLNRIL